MIRAWIIVVGALLLSLASPRIDSALQIGSVAIAGTETPKAHDFLAQNQVSSESAADRGIDLDQRQRSRFRYLMLGYGLIWLTLGAYLLSLNRRIRQVGQEIGELSGRLEDSKRTGSRSPR